MGKGQQGCSLGHQGFVRVIRVGIWAARVGVRAIMVGVRAARIDLGSLGLGFGPPELRRGH